MSEWSDPRSLEQKIADLKRNVVNKCAERIAAARKKPKEPEKEDDPGITSRFKRDHGL